MKTGLHTHPGFDAAYLLEGDLTVLERGYVIAIGSSHSRPSTLLQRIPGLTLACYAL